LKAHESPEGFTKTEAEEPESTTLLDAPPPHLKQRGIEAAESHDLHHDQDDSFREPWRGDEQEVEHDASQENTAWIPKSTHGALSTYHLFEDAHSVSKYSQAIPSDRYIAGPLGDSAPYPPQEPNAS